MINVGIELDGHGVVAGALVHGHVVVDTAEPVRPGAMRVGLVWQARRVDRPDVAICGRVVSQTVDDVVEGHRVVPFALATPAQGPLSFAGTAVRLEWFVEAALEAASFGDEPTWRAGFVVDAGEQAHPFFMERPDRRGRMRSGELALRNALLGVVPERVSRGREFDVRLDLDDAADLDVRGTLEGREIFEGDASREPIVSTFFATRLAFERESATRYAARASIPDGAAASFFVVDPTQMAPAVGCGVRWRVVVESAAPEATWIEEVEVSPT